MPRSQENVIIQHTRNNTGRYQYHFTLTYNNAFIPKSPYIKVFVMVNADDIQNKYELQYPYDFKIERASSSSQRGGTVVIKNQTNIDTRLGITYNYVRIEKAVPYDQPNPSINSSSGDIVANIDRLTDQIQQLKAKVAQIESIKGIYHYDGTPTAEPSFINPPHNKNTMLVSGSDAGDSITGSEATIANSTLFVPKVEATDLKVSNIDTVTHKSDYLTIRRVYNPTNDPNNEVTLTNSSAITEIEFNFQRGDAETPYFLIGEYLGGSQRLRIRAVPEISGGGGSGGGGGKTYDVSPNFYAVANQDGILVDGLFIHELTESTASLSQLVMRRGSSLRLSNDVENPSAETSYIDINAAGTTSSGKVKFYLPPEYVAAQTGTSYPLYLTKESSDTNTWIISPEGKGGGQVVGQVYITNVTAGFINQAVWAGHSTPTAESRDLEIRGNPHVQIDPSGVYYNYVLRMGGEYKKLIVHYLLQREYTYTEADGIIDIPIGQSVEYAYYNYIILLSSAEITSINISPADPMMHCNRSIRIKFVATAKIDIINYPSSWHISATSQHPDNADTGGYYSSKTFLPTSMKIGEVFDMRMTLLTIEVADSALMPMIYVEPLSQNVYPAASGGQSGVVEAADLYQRRFDPYASQIEFKYSLHYTDPTFKCVTAFAVLHHLPHATDLYDVQSNTAVQSNMNYDIYQARDISRAFITSGYSYNHIVIQTAADIQLDFNLATRFLVYVTGNINKIIVSWYSGLQNLERREDDYATITLIFTANATVAIDESGYYSNSAIYGDYKTGDVLIYRQAMSGNQTAGGASRYFHELIYKGKTSNYSLPTIVPNSSPPLGAHVDVLRTHSPLYVDYNSPLFYQEGASSGQNIGYFFSTKDIFLDCTRFAERPGALDYYPYNEQVGSPNPKRYWAQQESSTSVEPYQFAKVASLRFYKCAYNRFVEYKTNLNIANYWCYPSNPYVEGRSYAWADYPFLINEYADFYAINLNYKIKNSISWAVVEPKIALDGYGIIEDMQRTERNRELRKCMFMKHLKIFDTDLDLNGIGVDTVGKRLDIFDIVNTTNLPAYDDKKVTLYFEGGVPIHLFYPARLSKDLFTQATVGYKQIQNIHFIFDPVPAYSSSKASWYIFEGDIESHGYENGYAQTQPSRPSQDPDYAPDDPSVPFKEEFAQLRADKEKLIGLSNLNPTGKVQTISKESDYSQLPHFEVLNKIETMTEAPVRECVYDHTAPEGEKIRVTKAEIDLSTSTYTKEIMHTGYINTVIYTASTIDTKLLQNKRLILNLEASLCFRIAHETDIDEVVVQGFRQDIQNLEIKFLLIRTEPPTGVLSTTYWKLPSNWFSDTAEDEPVSGVKYLELDNIFTRQNPMLIFVRSFDSGVTFHYKTICMHRLASDSSTS